MLRTLFVVFFSIYLSGCAHEITVQPADFSRIEAGFKVKSIQRPGVYGSPAANRALMNGIDVKTMTCKGRQVYFQAIAIKQTVHRSTTEFPGD